MSFLTLQGLSKSYGPVRALDAVDLAVAAGSRTAVVGPSGSGKTTLMRLIAGFEEPDAGRIMLEGRLLAQNGTGLPAHRRGIGVVAQDGALFPHLSVAENIGFGLARRFRGRDERILALMDLVELARPMAQRRPHELSGGQQQRVALARTLAREPRLILFDEPFSALDAGLRESMRKAVASLLAATGITAILVTHDQAEALSFADQVAVLRAGRLVQAGPPRLVYAQPCDAATAIFLGEAILLPAQVEDGFARCALGRIAVAATARLGPGDIMLRPEQIRLVPVSPEAAPAPGLGVVTQVDFGGAACQVVLQLPDGTALSLRGSSHDLPAIGESMQALVAGTAHVFEEPQGGPTPAP